MVITPPPTKYAPAERASKEELRKQVKIFKKNDILNKFLKTIPSVFVIVNKYRQVVYMNEGALDFSGMKDFLSVIGKRPGEMFGCIHHAEEEGGCGTSESCTYCGALNVVLESQKGKPSVDDCRLTCEPDQRSFDLRIWAYPLEVEGELFTSIVIQDIKDEKRKEIYEKVFFHDIINTISGLTSILQIIREFPDKVNTEEYLDKIDYYTRNIFEEVEFHRILTAAENKSLILNIESYKSADLLREISNNYENQPIVRSRTIIIDSNVENIEFRTDRTVLRRILRNMINNALEATKEGGKVNIGCKKVDNSVEFWVQNEGVIPRKVQLQIFQRSFSTKGKNRGLGTYSMKLLSSFLKGEIKFYSSEKKGTIFLVIFPRDLTS